LDEGLALGEEGGLDMCPSLRGWRGRKRTAMEGTLSGTSSDYHHELLHPPFVQRRKGGAIEEQIEG